MARLGRARVKMPTLLRWRRHRRRSREGLRGGAAAFEKADRSVPARPRWPKDCSRSAARRDARPCLDGAAGGGGRARRAMVAGARAVPRSAEDGDRAACGAGRRERAEPRAMIDAELQSFLDRPERLYSPSGRDIARNVLERAGRVQRTWPATAGPAGTRCARCCAKPKHRSGGAGLRQRDGRADLPCW